MIVPHDRLPLLLRDGVDAEVEVVRELDLPVARLAAAAAEPGLALRHQGELHSEGVGELGLLRAERAVVGFNLALRQGGGELRHAGLRHVRLHDDDLGEEW